MKNNTVLKGAALFSTAALLVGTLAGCSFIEDAKAMVDELLPPNPLELIMKAEPDHVTVPNEAELVTPGDSVIVTMPTTYEPETEPEDWDTTEPITEPPETEPIVTEPLITDPPRMTGPGEITASVLNVRKYPGMDYDVIRGLERGTRVVILEQTMVDGQAWGRITDGWISMQYVALDDVIQGSWYELVDQYDDTYVYNIWDFYEDSTFGYTRCSLTRSEDYGIVRQTDMGGGRYALSNGTLQMELTYGDSVRVCGGYIGVYDLAVVDADIIGATMSWWDDGSQTLSKGNLETIQKLLRKNNPA